MKARLFLLCIFATACVVSPVRAAPMLWPDWSQAASYGDSIGEVEVAHPCEDMTTCFVMKGTDFIFFRAEFVGPSPPERDLDIYLDTVPGGKTGMDNGHSLHDLAADYRISYGSAPANLFRWNGATWEHLGAAPYQTTDPKSVDFAVGLVGIGDPAFPIKVLFISTMSEDATDWSPNVGHIIYPPAVGGAVLGSETWLVTLGLAGSLLLCGAFLMSQRRKRL